MPDKIDEQAFEVLDPKELSAACLSNQNLMLHVMQNHQGRFSLAGAQDKIPMNLKDGQILLPTRGAPTTHILKPPHIDPSVKESVYNEYFCMKLASRVGLNVPEVDIIVSEVPFYIIQRYDRTTEDEKVRRLHQFDFCQIQNRLSSEKYEEDGGPKLADNYDCIRTNSSNVIGDSKQYLKWLAFNMLIGNNDSHSKNLSMLMDGKGRKLAPFYDLLCTAIYTSYSQYFAFTVDNIRPWGQWSKTNFQRELAQWGLTKKNELLLRAVEDMMSLLENNLENECLEFSSTFPQINTAGRIRDEIEKRIKSFRKRL